MTGPERPSLEQLLDRLRARQATARHPGSACAECEALPGSVSLPVGDGTEAKDPRYARLRTLATLDQGAQLEIRLCPDCGALWSYRYEGQTYQLSFSPSDPDEINPALEEARLVDLREAAAILQAWPSGCWPDPGGG